MLTDRELWLQIAEERRSTTSKCLRRLERFSPGSGQYARKRLIQRALYEASRCPGPAKTSCLNAEGNHA